MKRIKILVRKNLKMTPGKIAAQCVHVALGLDDANPWMSVVVLIVSDAKFKEAQNIQGSLLQCDAGYTEVPNGTATCLAYLEDDPHWFERNAEQAHKHWYELVDGVPTCQCGLVLILEPGAVD